MLGYTNRLYILPFDHRDTYAKLLFGKKRIDAGERKLAEDYKKVIFDGFLKVWTGSSVTARGEYVVFLDEEFCDGIIKKARKKEVLFGLAVEKSGKKTFTFEHGKKFGEAILAQKPNFVKTLVRYYTTDADCNRDLQLCRLKQLSEWCRENQYKFIIELLVPPQNGDGRRYGNRRKFDEEVRPGLTVRAVKESYDHGIEADIWKIEAMEKKSDWNEVIKVIRSGRGKKEVGIVMLGRGESFARVKQWIQECPKDKVNGFAVGRTVWLRSLMDLHEGNISKREAAEQIGYNFRELIRLWKEG